MGSKSVCWLFFQLFLCDWVLRHLDIFFHIKENGFCTCSVVCWDLTNHNIRHNTFEFFLFSKDSCLCYYLINFLECTFSKWANILFVNSVSINLYYMTSMCHHINKKSNMLNAHSCVRVLIRHSNRML